MIRTFIYFPEELDREIKRLVISTKKSKAAVIREALQEGLTTIKRKRIRGGGAEVLLKIARRALKQDITGPEDLSKNLDKYLWDEYEL